MIKYPITMPEITEQDVAQVAAATRNDWFPNDNQSVYKFEQAFARQVNRKYAIALPSCTSAIHLALAVLELAHNDEVIVPDVTWIASAAPIAYIGATTILVDINLTNWCMDVQAFLQAITANTKAVIVVDLYGSMPMWHEIIAIARDYNIFIIEDAAEALGSCLLYTSPSPRDS